MGFVRSVWLPSSAALVLWACATTEDPDLGSGSGGSSGRGGASSTGGTKASTGGVSNTGGTLTNTGGSTSTSGGVGSNTGGSTNTGGISEVGGAGSGGGGVPSSVLERASVILYYSTNVPSATTNKIHAQLYLENKSADRLPLASVAIRYWLTSEVGSPSLHNYYSGPSIQGQTQTFVEDGANSYVELNFTGSTITRGADLNASEMQLDLDGGNYDQSDDWSWEPAYSMRSPHDKITVYLANKLIWGCEPGGDCAGAGEGGAGGQGGGAGQGGSAGTPSTGGQGGSTGGSEGGSGPISGGAGGESPEGGATSTGGSAGQGGAGGS